MTSNLHFRTALPTDAPGIADALNAFGDAPIGTDRWSQRCDMARRSAAYWRVGIDQDRVVCAAKAAPSAVWFGQSRIAWADVGDVCVSPLMQASGIGTLAMNDMVAHLRATGCPISRLGGLVRFYSRFGYERFPRCYIEFPVQAEIHAGASKKPFVETLRPTPGLAKNPGVIRPFSATRDVPALWNVMEKFNRHRTGCRVWNRPISADGMDHVLVYDSPSGPAGMMVYHVLPQDFTPSEAKLTIYELAYDPDQPHALEALIKHALQVAFDNQATRATAYLPADARLLEDLDAIAVDYNLCQTNGVVASNMVQVTNLSALLSAIAPELTRRSQGIPWSGSITFESGNQRAGIALAHGQVSTTDGAQANLTLKMTHAQFLKTLLGITPAIWPNMVSPAHPACPALLAMFPPIAGGYNS